MNDKTEHTFDEHKNIYLYVSYLLHSMKLACTKGLMQMVEKLILYL